MGKQRTAISSNSRRGFFKASAAGLAISRSVLGANDTVRMGVIGTGTRGTQVHGAFIHHKDVAFVAACDVAKDRLDQFLTANAGAKMDQYRDYRRVLDRQDIDAVLITTPDQWHSPIMVAALDAGKDVYVEKPVSNTIEAALKMRDAARSHKQVVQVGLQQRSWNHFQECARMIREGHIGRITHCVMNFASSYTRAPEQPQDPPATLDWEMFQGPAPRRPYVPSRQRVWRSYYDYGGGIVTDWGVHLWDVATWFMNADTMTPLLTSASAQYVRFDVPAKVLPVLPLHLAADIVYGVDVELIVADLVRARPVDLAIVDGVESIRGGEGTWNPGVQLIKPGLMLAGRNPVCLDAVSMAVMGYDPHADRGTKPFLRGDNTLKLCEAEGVGSTDLSRIEVAGLSIKEALHDYGPGPIGQKI